MQSRQKKTGFMAAAAVAVILFSGLGCRAVTIHIERTTPTPEGGLPEAVIQVAEELSPTPVPPTETPLPPTETSTPKPPAATPTRTPRPPTATPTEAPPTPTLEFESMVVQIYPQDGSMADQLLSEAQIAIGLGLKPFAEFSATWCPACQAIEETIDTPLMKDAFKGTYIIQLDVDEWTEAQWEEAGFEFIYIPIYFRLDDQGQPHDWIDGSAWDENIPVNMAPPLKRFFNLK